MVPNRDVKDILRKHSSRIESRMKISGKMKSVDYTREYVKFKDEMAPNLNRYERWCKSLGSVIKLKIAKKDEDKIRKHLEIAHLDVEPWQALTLSVVAFFSVLITHKNHCFF